MANFLEQDEIDALLDITDEDGEVVGAENIGIISLLGSNPSELQEICIGSRGLIITEQQNYKASKEKRFYTIVAIDDTQSIAVIVDDHFNPKKINISELEGCFYKDSDRLEAIEIKNTFDQLSKFINDNVGIEFNDFLVALKSSKEVYPEIWL
jgi:hypothetical protein